MCKKTKFASLAVVIGWAFELDMVSLNRSGLRLINFCKTDSVRSKCSPLAIKAFPMCPIYMREECIHDNLLRLFLMIMKDIHVVCMRHEHFDNKWRLFSIYVFSTHLFGWSKNSQLFDYGLSSKHVKHNMSN